MLIEEFGEKVKFLEDLCSAVGPSGYEEEAVSIWKEYVSRFAEVRGDVHGNAIACVNPGREVKVLITGHIDEIGFMIRYVDENGFLYFSPIGGIDPNLVPGQRVKIKTANGFIKGVIGKKPIHLMEREELQKCAKIDTLFIDIGAENKESALKMVEIGDVAVPWVEFWEVNERVVSKALDDRSGAYVVARVLEVLSERDLNVSVYGVATVQEEIGLRGAKTSAFGIDPQVGIAVDVTFATDYPGVEKKKVGEVTLGKGPVIARGPNISPIVFKRLKEVAELQEIPYQVEGIPRATGTDANSIQLTRAGVATGLVSIPLRYMHTPVEMADFRDLENCVRLIADFVSAISGEEDWTLW